jgi:hypothetical protein
VPPLLCRSYDTDNKGYLDEQNVKMVAQSLYPNKADFPNVMAKWDTSADGKVVPTHTTHILPIHLKPFCEPP